MTTSIKLSKKQKSDLTDKLNAFKNAWTELSGQFLEIDDINDIIVDECPFDRSFDELGSDVSAWIENIQEQMDKIKPLNLYGNEYGCHTPELTKKTFEALKDFDHQFEGFSHKGWDDSSWHNNTCDSLLIDFMHKSGETSEQIELWLPNIEDENSITDVDIPHYTVQIRTYNNNDNSNRDSDFKTLEEAVAFIKSHKTVDALFNALQNEF